MEREVEDEMEGEMETTSCNLTLPYPTLTHQRS